VKGFGQDDENKEKDVIDETSHENDSTTN